MINGLYYPTPLRVGQTFCSCCGSYYAGSTGSTQKVIQRRGIAVYEGDIEFPKNHLWTHHKITTKNGILSVSIKEKSRA